MKIGMNFLLWTVSVTEEHYPIFPKLAETGFDGAEIPLHAGGERAQYQGIRDQLDAAGLECTAVMSVGDEHNPISPDAKVRQAAVDKLKWAVDTAHLLRSEVLCGPFHSAYAAFVGRGPNDAEHGWAADVLREVAEYADQAGITLMLEFLNRFECYYLTTAQGTRELIARIEHPRVKMLWDTHHAHIEEKDVATSMAASRSELCHVHVSENDRGVPGSGQVDWQGTFGQLQRNGFDGWLVIEAFSRIMPEFAAAVRIWRDYFSSPEEVYRDGYAFIKRMWEDG